MRNTISIACAVLCVLTAVVAHAQEKPSAADLEYFEKRVRPLLAKRCYQCHSAKAVAAKKLRGGLLLDSNVGITKGGDSGTALVPGEPENSLLIRAIGYKDNDLKMPPTGQLPDREIAELVDWVKRGAPVPADTTAVAVRDSQIDFGEGREFWSFQPLHKQNPPTTENGDWPKRRMDRFVQGRIEKQGLSSAPRADRRTLIRRATFDLTGLPPTPEEVEAFLNDAQPGAYRRLIERLLASPHYGEHWGRWWLDVARYSDSTASWLKSTANAWLYRDWVVQALNDDVPYDQFVKRQLATDLIDDTGPADNAALGFLGLSPTYWKELKLDQDVIKLVVAEEWDERIDAVTRSFLGLTVSCARCHDHKFDPISTEDYYALAGVFASTRLIDRALTADADAELVRRARDKVRKIDARITKLKDLPDKEAAKKKTADLSKQIAQIKKETPHYNAPMAHAVEDAALYVLPDGPDRTKLEYKPGEPRDVPLFIRGNPAKPGPIMRRRFLTVLSSGEPAPFQRGSGRLDLADAIFHEGGPLAARVIVNRVWLQHFGSALVDTPSNFGTQGSIPTHPKLLDDLAARFVEQGWSLKWLHREIMLSATYQQASAHHAENYARDPNNRWLWRMNRRRLNVEAWRDAMLAVSGTLDRKLGGAAMPLGDAKNHRRTIYARIERREVHTMLRLYDFPDPTGHSPARNETTTPLQQLFVLNSSFLRTQATALARRLNSDAPGDVAQRVDRAYQLLYGRPATEAEVQLAREFLGEPGNENSWIPYTHALLGSNEFMFID